MSNERDYGQDQLTALEIMDKRRKYLFALAISLGALPDTAVKYIEKLIRQSNELSKLDITKKASDNNPTYVKEIEKIGKIFFKGSSKDYTEFNYHIGIYIIGLITKDINSRYFTDLHTRIEMWTKGHHISYQKFLDMINKDDNTAYELARTLSEKR